MLLYCGRLLEHLEKPTQELGEHRKAPNCIQTLHLLDVKHLSIW